MNSNATEQPAPHAARLTCHHTETGNHVTLKDALHAVLENQASPDDYTLSITQHSADSLNESPAPATAMSIPDVEPGEGV